MLLFNYKFLKLGITFLVKLGIFPTRQQKNNWGRYSLQQDQLLVLGRIAFSAFWNLKNKNMIHFNTTGRRPILAKFFLASTLNIIYVILSGTYIIALFYMSLILLTLKYILQKMMPQCTGEKWYQCLPLLCKNWSKASSMSTVCSIFIWLQYKHGLNLYFLMLNFCLVKFLADIEEKYETHILFLLSTNSRIFLLL